VDLINKKRAGKPITAKARPSGDNVVDLMEALRRSVGGAATESQAAGKPAKKSRKASAGQKEMRCLSPAGNRQRIPRRRSRRQGRTGSRPKARN
jgi:DNA end-binding protein Ku